ncbi:hypothetical protein K3495_g17090, partial [Podosphaera aphanis]
LWENTPSLQASSGEEAFIAKNRWQRSRIQDRPRSPKSRARGSRCFQCLSEEHRIDVCPYKETAKEVAKEWAVQQRLNDERLPHTLRSKQKSKFQPMPKNLTSKERNVHFEEPRSARVAQAYSAKDIDNDCYEDDNEEEALDTEHEDGDISEEGLMAFRDRHPRTL